MSQEYPPQAPSLNTHAGAVVGPLSPIGGYVYLTKPVLGWSPSMFPAIIIQAVASATVDVMGLDGVTWCTYPGASNSIAAGKLKVIRGRWTALRVTTADVIWVKGDLNAFAYNGEL